MSNYFSRCTKVELQFNIFGLISVGVVVVSFFFYLIMIYFQQSCASFLMCPCFVFRYYETISEVLSSVRKMEESLKRLKQARKGASTTTTAGANGGPTDDSKIRLQLALDVEYLGEQVGGA